MLPTLEPGDHVLVRRTRSVVRGDLVVFSDPESDQRLVAKRVAAVHPDGLEVVGDNRGASRDSRDFGIVAHSRVLGVAWYRYVPTSRAGRIG
jgi:nickel-type superoxide dismutase maturation protease